jgi:L-fuculose-phosphate aldolase
VGGDDLLRHEIVRVCGRLYARGLVAGPDGNVSARIGRDVILVTPAGMSKVDVGARDIVAVGLDGAPLDRSLQPSSELRMHLRIYRRRPDVRAIVHAHPPVATGFSVAGEDFMTPVLPEVILQMGAVPLVPYGTPGTDALADVIEPFLDHHDAFLMANHGATTLGRSLAVAHQRMESVEHAARILLVARLLGRVNRLGADDERTLLRLRDAAWAADRGAEGRARMSDERGGIA